MNMFNFPLLVLTGIYHCRKYIFPGREKANGQEIPFDWWQVIPLNWWFGGFEPLVLVGAKKQTDELRNKIGEMLGAVNPEGFLTSLEALL